MKENKNKEIIDNYSIVINRKNIKNTYIRIDESFNIVVNTNQYTSKKEIDYLILKHHDKIVKMIHNKKRLSLLPNQMPYLGKVYEIKTVENKNFFYEINKDQIIFYTPFSLNDSIDLFYKEEAKKILPLRLKHCHQHFNEIISIPYPSLSIRKMKSRYGTCYYTKNKINLNSYIIKYNIETIDYVINHELCHFIHHNHSKNFYQLLDTINPNHRIIRKNLNKY
ncbi:M48 family metallopeptidase [Mycoplasmatota bacterium]|nr:M48 family metallopeptidase [Mycoplasmatota bacterium]